MVTLSDYNKIRLQAIAILIVAHIYIILILPADREFKISLSYIAMLITALFIILRTRLLRRKKEIKELL